MMDYDHTKFDLIWIKENKVTEGVRIPPPPPPQFENVLNRPGEIGLKKGTFFTHLVEKYFQKIQFRYFTKAGTNYQDKLKYFDIEFLF